MFLPAKPHTISNVSLWKYDTFRIVASVFVIDTSRACVPQTIVLILCMFDDGRTWTSRVGGERKTYMILCDLTQMIDFIIQQPHKMYFPSPLSSRTLTCVSKTNYRHHIHHATYIIYKLALPRFSL